jgi:hypothetical protein
MKGRKNFFFEKKKQKTFGLQSKTCLGGASRNTYCFGYVALAEEHF